MKKLISICFVSVFFAILITSCGNRQQTHNTNTVGEEKAVLSQTADEVSRNEDSSQTAETITQDSGSELKSTETTEDEESAPSIDMVMENAAVYDEDGITITLNKIEISSTGDSTGSIHVINHCSANVPIQFTLQGIGLNGFICNAKVDQQEGETTFDVDEEGDIAFHVNFTQDTRTNEYSYQRAFREIDAITGTNYAELPVEIINCAFHLDEAGTVNFDTVIDIPTVNYVPGEIESVFMEDHYCGYYSDDLSPGAIDVYQFTSDEKVNILMKGSLSIPERMYINGEYVLTPGVEFETGLYKGNFGQDYYYYFETLDIGRIRTRMDIPENVPIEINMEGFPIVTVESSM